MNKYKSLFLLIILLGCGKTEVISTTKTPPAPVPCTVSKVGSVTTISCPDGTTSTVNDGANGAQGYSIGMFNNSATAEECPNGGENLNFFQDLNNSDIYVKGETVISIIQVCNGLNGTNGNNGNNGANGTNGTNGTNGSSSIVSVSQASQTQCANGGLVLTTQTSGVSSTNTVCNGSTGPQGQQGPAGIDLSSVSMVQFCPGYTTSYPNSFPEFAMCVNNSLYGVYWDKSNSWLAEIVPGYYASTSTSAPCNFNVTSNCIVTH